MGGADPQRVEIRAPSLKGVIRFWWRALNGNLEIKDMKQKEAELFGSSDKEIGRSKLCIRIPTQQMKTKSYSPVPHWEDKNRKPFKIPAIDYGQSFQVLLTSIGDKSTHEEYQAIFETTILLGGFGKRCRRGFGSIEIIKRNGDKYNSPKKIDELFELLEKVNPGQFSISEDGKRIISKGFKGSYPYIKEIEIGKNYFNIHGLLKTIGHATSDYFGISKSKDRFASPIYVSVIRYNEGYKPIITTLNTSFHPGRLNRKNNLDNQQAFKEAIL
jgi:CRISPR-associated protein Cmr1